MEERKKQVLNAIIKDYIANAEPVGSRAVAKKYDLGVSPATIRNEMSDLTEDGYIEQPHTSAGRIPSAKGYRFYVDNLMERPPLRPEERQQVRQAMSGDLTELDDFMRNCCAMISRLTNYASIAAIPERGHGSVENIQLIPLNERQALVIILASTGIIRHKVIDLPGPISPAQLSAVERAMVKALRGAEMRSVSYELLDELLRKYQMQEAMAAQALDLLEQTLRPESSTRIFTGGATHMLSQPEFQDLEKLKSIFSLLEADNKLKELLEKVDPGKRTLTITIGGEMPVEGVKDCSMVVANYFVNGEKAGSIGVLGPTRMRYGRTVSLMETIAGELSRAMDEK
ncbi:MAG: heat-inducible transcription repressor HrcA [Firmicutes bacterium]|nr:heat-inducible transcription repressor HrcA [Bacillota bacterium]